MSVSVMARIWAEETLSPTPRLILLSLADHANDEGVCYPSIARLCKRTGLSERAIQKHIGELAASGWLMIDRAAGPKGCNVFTVCTPAHDAPPHDMHPRTTCANTPAPRAPKPSRETSVSKNTRDALFADFWDAFPHRNGAKKDRAKAKTKWDAIARQGKHDLEAIVEAARRYQRDGAVLRGYGKGPVPWLNGECWNDEIEPENNHGNGNRRTSSRPSPHSTLFAAARSLAGGDDGRGAEPLSEMRDVTPPGEAGLADGQGGNASEPFLRIIDGRS